MVARFANARGVPHRACRGEARVSRRVIAARRRPDGLFLDTYCPTILWAQWPDDSIDWQRSGWETVGDFHRAWTEGHRLYAERLRELVGSKLLVGNCGPSGERDVLNGWMRENFPRQNGGDWRSNMERTPWGDLGYLNERYQEPRLSWLSAIASGDSATDERIARFVVGSASLGEGVGVVVPMPLIRGGPARWFKAWDVRLGEPRGPAYQMPDGRWFRMFAGGFLVVDTVRQDATFTRWR